MKGLWVYVGGIGLVALVAIGMGLVFGPSEPSEEPLTINAINPGVYRVSPAGSVQSYRPDREEKMQKAAEEHAAKQGGKAVIVTRSSSEIIFTVASPEDQAAWDAQHKGQK